MIRLFKALFKFVVFAFILFVIVGILATRYEKKKREEKKQQQIIFRQEETKQDEDPKEIVEIVEEPEEIVEVVEEPEEIVEVEEEKKDENGIRPEFRESMEAYEDFFDEYCEFMKSYSKDASLTSLTKYFEFMSKYEKAMSEMESVDESKLTEAEDKLYLETMLRINNKLTQVLIDME